MQWPSADWDHAGGFYKTIKWTMTRPMKWLCRIHARGIENVPLGGPLIVAVNHWSWWDPIIVGASLPRPMVYLAKSGLFRTRFGKWVFEDLARQIPVDRTRGGNDDALRRSLEALALGRAVAVYPEGTRSLPPDLLPAKTGVARLALASGAPVLPIACLTDRFWSRRTMLPQIGRRTYVNIGAPIWVARDPVIAEDRDATRKVTDEIMARIRALLDEAASARDRSERWSWTPANGRLFGG